jgi:hypothetical protein
MLLQPGAVGPPRRADDPDGVREPWIGGHAVVPGRGEEVAGRLERAVLPAERVGEGRDPGPGQLAGGQCAEQPALQQVLLAGLARRAQRVAAAGTGLEVQQALQHVERGVKRRTGRAVHPLAVPAAVGQAMAGKPPGQGRDVGAQPRAVGEGVCVDAAVHLAAPVGQAAVVPAAVRGEQSGRAGQDGGIQAPVAQGIEGPGGGGPRLPGTLGCFGTLEVEIAGEERSARPLPVGLLEREQACPEPFGGDPGPGGGPYLLRRAHQVAFDLPAQRRVGIEQPVGHRGGEDHSGTLPGRSSARFRGSGRFRGRGGNSRAGQALA